jgi:COPII coat assembly protein SEC16
MSKPSLDSTLTWLEGRFTKLITGDGDSTPPPTEQASRAEQQAFGPFSHYSTISSATTSARSSPQPSISNPNILPPRRSGSAMGVPPVSSSHIQIDRASSAMDYIRHKPLSGELVVPPMPRVASASAATTTFAQSQSFGQVVNGYSSSSSFQSIRDSKELLTPTPDSVNGEGSNQEVSWWGSSSYGTESSAATPTAAAFLRVDESTVATSSDGFISLMDDSAIAVVANDPAKNDPLSHSEEDEEDLGFGNSSSKRKATLPNDDQDSTSQSSPTAESKSEPAKAVRPGEYTEL